MFKISIALYYKTCILILNLSGCTTAKRIYNLRMQAYIFFTVNYKQFEEYIFRKSWDAQKSLKKTYFCIKIC